MTTYGAPVCLDCRHFDLVTMNTCQAFPAGIPKEILDHGNRHAKPVQGDQGIRFEAKRKP